MLLKLSTVAAVVLLAVTSSSQAFPTTSPSFLHSSDRFLAPIISSVEADTIPDSYFVVFKDGVRVHEHSAWVRELHREDMVANGAMWDGGEFGGDDEFMSGVRHVYDMGSFQGLAGRFSPEVLNEIRRNPDVSVFLFALAIVVFCCACSDN